MTDIAIENPNFGKRNTLYKENSFKKRGIFYWIDVKNIKEAKEERRLLIESFEKTFEINENWYENNFLRGFFRKEWETMSLYHQIIEWNLEIKEQWWDASLFIEQFWHVYIRERIQKSLQEIKQRLSFPELQEKKRTLFLQIASMQQEQKERREHLREKNQESKQKYLQELEEKIDNETNTKKLQSFLKLKKWARNSIENI